MAPAYTIGVDFGTNSVRAVVVRCADGQMIGTRVFNYPSGDQGVLLDPRDPTLRARTRPTTWRGCGRRSPAHWLMPRASPVSSRAW